MCTSPNDRYSQPRPAPCGGDDPENDEYDLLHRGDQPEELTLAELTLEGLMEHILVMSQLRRAILLLLTGHGHDHCPICLGCRVPRGDAAPGDGDAW